MRITKHEAAVLSTALLYAKDEIIDHYFSDKDERLKAYNKLQLLERRLEKYETDNRLQSKSGRAYQYPTLTKIILNKLK